MIMAAVLGLSACAAPVAENQQSALPSTTKAKPTGSSPSTASGAEKAVPETKPRPLGIAVLDTDNFGSGRKHRKDILVDRLGSDALSPNDVGYYMEVAEADLRRRLSDGIDVKVNKQNGNIVIGPIGAAFSSGSVQLGNRLRTALGKSTPVFLEFTKTFIIIHAYTDAKGAAAYNRKLSTRRALAVAHYLLKAGISSNRLAVVGHGESGPVASNHTPKGRAENRRITIELDPLVHHQAGP